MNDVEARDWIFLASVLFLSKSRMLAASMSSEEDCSRLVPNENSPMPWSYSETTRIAFSFCLELNTVGVKIWKQHSWSKVVGKVFCNYHLTDRHFFNETAKNRYRLSNKSPALPHSMLLTEKALFCYKCPECGNFISTDQHWVGGGGKLLIVPTFLSRIEASWNSWIWKELFRYAVYKITLPVAGKTR